MHEANIVYQNFIGPDFVLIHNSKLRFTQCIHSFVHYTGNDEDRLRWENTNWEDLDQLFKIIPRDNDFPIHVATHGRKPTLLNYISSPEHFFLSPSTFVSILEYMAQNRTSKIGNHSLTINLPPRSPMLQLANDSPTSSGTSSYHPYRGVSSTKGLASSALCAHRT
ncbi:hypothetical protein BT96DRAFT_1009292 [Gymnopus androsaceus JB14]|uniref:Uncharacterized protein n=1 Tax=Gymnopus androsaceus JB14 TaxID=1447944 RepID=A0A6A4GCY1_9AGAR|nr:hypothetical protein BT96DRAFT_1009292 [Gymnopus androsaceus JB14]